MTIQCEPAKSIATVDPHLVKEWDYERNRGFTPETVSFGSNQFVFWKCPNCGNGWKALVYRRHAGKGKCPHCYPRETRPFKIEDSLAVRYPKIARQWHPTKNGNKTPYDYSYGSGKEVWWYDDTCRHEWPSRIANRTLNGSNCPYCNSKIVTFETSLASVNPKLAKEWNYVRNLDRPETVFPNSGKEVWWKCSNSKCNYEWHATIANRNFGKTGCPSCGDHGKILTREKSLGFLYPEIALEWDNDGNCGKTPYDFFPHSDHVASWKCKRKQHKFRARIADKVSNKVICRDCTKEFKTSFPEQAILFYLSKIFDHVQNRYLFNTGIRNEEIDVYIPDIRVCIEYDGHRHTNKEKDENKNEVLQENKVHLIRIREEGLPILKDLGVTIIYRKEKQKTSSLRDCIVKLAEILVDRYELSPIQIKKLKALRHINIAQDSAKIYSQFLLLEKENSLARLHPELLDEWDYNFNNGVDPNNLGCGSHYLAGWICRECGHPFKAQIYHRTHPYTMRGKTYLGSGCPQCAWTKRQRTRMETIKNKPATTEKQNEQWEKMFNQLLNYKEEHGDCEVPKKYPPNPKLANWVRTQRRNHTKGILLTTREEKLNQAEFTWRTKT